MCGWSWSGVGKEMDGVEGVERVEIQDHLVPALLNFYPWQIILLKFRNYDTTFPCVSAWRPPKRDRKSYSTLLCAVLVLSEARIQNHVFRSLQFSPLYLKKHTVNHFMSGGVRTGKSTHWCDTGVWGYIPPASPTFFTLYPTFSLRKVKMASRTTDGCSSNCFLQKLQQRARMLLQ
jgi:hypothetical protein